jgi:2-polyprenyl-6-methoxyphenol hydroxylase-like FAD-dependent oxidoreductase
LSIELGQRGIRCLVVERNDRVGYSPRAKTTNVRTREHLRRWGIADALRDASPIPADYPSNVVFATRMNGFELARFENAFNGRRQRSNLYSEEAQWVPQYVLEEVLRAKAVSLPGVNVSFETEFLQVQHKDSDIRATLRNLRTGEDWNVDARFLVGADGARSSVRGLIGARMTGESAFSRNFTVIFKAPDLARRHHFGPAIMYWMVNDDVPSLLGPMDRNDVWFFMATKLPEGLDPERVDAVELIRKATGFADLNLDVVATDAWVAHRLVADRYSSGRIFLAGDACHLHPPFGGFGMNMGIGDAVDLGWKLAATLQGWGGVGLLKSYERERRPIHERTMAESVINYGVVGNQLVRPGLEEAGAAGEATREEIGEIIRSVKVREFKTLGLVLGSSYSGSPIIVPDGSEAPAEHSMVYLPCASPGCLAPHLWLFDGSSLYDHFGSGFTLLQTSNDSEGVKRATDQARAMSIPLKVLTSPDARLQSRYEARFVLIRPDQHVAWRGAVIPDDVAGLLRHVTGGFTPDEARSDSTPTPRRN